MSRSAVLVILLAALLHLPGVASAQDERKVEVDAERIYHGDPARFDQPGTIRADDVFMAIPAYRRIVDERIGKDDPHYWVLMEEANKVFRRGLSRTEREHGYDLIGEIGSILIDGEPVTEITKAVVEIVEKVARNAGG